MNKEDKSLLLKDLCARLPYGVKVEVCVKGKNIKSVDCVKYDTVGTYIRLMDDENFSIKPYLRPISSMTEEEREEENKLWDIITKTRNDLHYLYTDFLLSHHLDYRGLIPMGLALEAPEGMYNIKTE